MTKIDELIARVEVDLEDVRDGDGIKDLEFLFDEYKQEFFKSFVDPLFSVMTDLSKMLPAVKEEIEQMEAKIKELETKLGDLEGD